MHMQMDMSLVQVNPEVQIETNQVEENAFVTIKWLHFWACLLACRVCVGLFVGNCGCIVCVFVPVN